MMTVDDSQIKLALLLPVISWYWTRVSDLNLLPDFVWSLSPTYPTCAKLLSACRRQFYVQNRAEWSFVVGDVVAWQMCVGLAILVGGRCVARILSEVYSPIWSDIFVL